MSIIFNSLFIYFIYIYIYKKKKKKKEEEEKANLFFITIIKFLFYLLLS